MKKSQYNYNDDLFQYCWHEGIIDDDQWQALLLARSLKGKAMHSMEMKNRISSAMSYLGQPKSNSCSTYINRVAEQKWNRLSNIFMQYEQHELLHPHLINIALDVVLTSDNARRIKNILYEKSQYETLSLVVSDTMTAIELGLSVVFPKMKLASRHL